MLLFFNAPCKMNKPVKTNTCISVGRNTANIKKKGVVVVRKLPMIVAVTINNTFFQNSRNTINDNALANDMYMKNMLALGNLFTSGLIKSHISDIGKAKKAGAPAVAAPLAKPQLVNSTSSTLNAINHQ